MLAIDSDTFEFLSIVSSTVAIEALKQVSQLSVKSPCPGSPNTDLTWNSIHSSMDQISIIVSLCAWFDALQSPRGPFIRSKLGAFDDNLLLVSF